MSAILPSVDKAVAELRACFAECRVEADPDGSGGAYVTVHNVRLGAPYAQLESWIGFQITFQYPYADVYPHFARPDLSRADGRPLGEGLGGAQFRNQLAVQLSRRSNKLNPAIDTAALKLLKVLKWLRTHP